ncbi:MAG: hypothetical protein ABIJ36_00530 [Patescibacteria group bacterium]|nr:hypothetical protein [Patescibacteria group bacterium]
MPKQKYKTLILMPYLPLEGSFKFNTLIVWAYHKKKNDFIKDLGLMEHINKLVVCYRFQKGGAIKNPAVISIDKITFTNPIRVSIAKIEMLKNVLLFAGVLENKEWAFVTSDNFEVFYQHFNIGEEGISTQGGAIHRIIAGGYKINEVAFIKPEHVNIPLHFRPNNSVIRALENCVINSAKDQSKSQVIQSLNPFFNTYRNSHEHSWQSRILLLIMAFELLFGETGRPQFRDNIQKYSTMGSKLKFKRYTYPIVNWGGATSQGQLTLNQIWAEEFYKLRHRIIHGDTVYSDELLFSDIKKVVKQSDPHFYIAVNFYVVCVLNKLRELGFSSIPHFIVNPEAPKLYIGKNISGIHNERFKIMRISSFI